MLCVGLDIRTSTLPPIHLPPAFNQPVNPQNLFDDTKQMTLEEQREFAQRLQRQLSQISGMVGASSAILGYRGGGPLPQQVNGGAQAYPQVELRHHNRPEINLEAAFNAKHSKTFIDNMDFEFVRFILIFFSTWRIF